MKLDEILARSGLAPVCATFLPLDGACSGAAQSLAVHQGGARGAAASLYRGLMKFWVRLYARAPRRLRPMV
jgi:hypothetical protein